MQAPSPVLEQLVALEHVGLCTEILLAPVSRDLGVEFRLRELVGTLN